MIKAVVFDLDDTLIEEISYIKSGFKIISEVISKENKMDKDTVYNDMFNLFNKSSKYVYNRLFDKYGLSYTNEDIMRFVNLYREHKPDIFLNDKNVNLLKKLKSKGYKIGIITDGYKESQRQKIRVLKLNSYVDEIVVTDELGRDYWKPHPKAFEVIKEKLNVDFNQMIYIGDNPEKDFYISKIFPIKTVRLFSKGIHKDKKYYKNVRETYSIKDINEIFQILEEIKLNE